MLKEILQAKTRPGHLLVMVLLFLAAGIVIVFMIPVFMWLFVTGDAGYPNSWESIMKIVLVMGAPVILLPITYGLTRSSFKKGDLPSAKSYLFASAAVIAVMLFAWYTVIFEK